MSEPSSNRLTLIQRAGGAAPLVTPCLRCGAILAPTEHWRPICYADQPKLRTELARRIPGQPALPEQSAAGVTVFLVFLVLGPAYLCAGPGGIAMAIFCGAILVSHANRTFSGFCPTAHAERAARLHNSAVATAARR